MVLRELAVAVALVGAMLLGAAPASATAVICSDQPSVLTCDSDGDGYVDVVEEAVCGTATCATGAEDVNHDGVPDVVAYAASLKQGGPAGPVQQASPSELIVVSPDGAITTVNLWLFASGAAFLLAALAVYVVLRRRALARRPSRGVGRHSAREVTS
ncbi:MAG: hypothetical protein ABI632_03680 [Pseudolysinimonas sp.]